MAPQQYSKWLDQHSSADVAARVAAALQAAKGEAAAAAAGDAGKAAVLAVMRQLCGVE
jgi:Tfp pilus assembly protein FimT